MVSPIANRAIADTLHYGKALLKFISPNDTGRTGSHQAGYYLPKSLWSIFAPRPPQQGMNHDHFVDVLWHDGRVTNSCVKWYGRGTRSEYRLTRFGRDFPWITYDNVGDLLVLIPTHSNTAFSAYVLDNDDDIEQVQAELGVEIIGTFAAYPPEQTIESEEDCIRKQFLEFIAQLKAFPSTDAFSERAQKALELCIQDFLQQSSDWQLMRLVDAEYSLFKMVERLLCQDEVTRLYKDIDDFLKTASSIMNRRKSRAGRSFENHAAYILKNAAVPFEPQPSIKGNPDLIIPSRIQLPSAPLARGVNPPVRIPLPAWRSPAFSADGG